MIWNFIIQAVIMFAISLALQPKIKVPKKKPLTEADFDIPTAEEGRSFQWLFGKKFSKGPNVVWFGDVNPIPVIKRMKTSLFNTKRQTIGYMYYVGMHLIFGFGNVDGAKQIKVGESWVWPDPTDKTSEASDGATLATINAMNIFGGVEKEGGVAGDVRIEYGESTQGQNAYLVSQLGSVIPAFRGQTGLVLEGTYVGNNGYLKPWSVMWKRTDTLTNGQQQWYLAKANIGDDDLNPAHMIRECLTDLEAGLGYPELGIEESDFQYAADLLYTENFGLSALWDASVPMEDFIGKILEHIDGSLYQNQATGKWSLILARDDYTPATLDIYNENDIMEIMSFDRPGFGEVASQTTVKWTDRRYDKPRTVQAQDIALIAKQSGNIIESYFDYAFIHDGNLATKIANRELKQATSMLAAMRLKCTRRMANITPYSVFKISWSKRNIVEMIVRAVSIDYGDLDSNEIYINCVEDVFGQAHSVYADPPDTLWTDPRNLPVDTTYRRLIEAPYFALRKDLFTSSEIAALPDTAAFFIASAIKPISDAFDFLLLVQDVTEGYTEEGGGNFTPSATIVGSLPIGGIDVAIDLVNIVGFESIELNSWAIIDDEIVEIVSIGTNQVTIARGVLDTLPAAHSISARIWFVESGLSLVEREYTTNNTPDAKFLTRTALGTLAEGSATSVSAAAFDGRMIRPYPPARLTINNNYFPEYFTGQPSLTWRHRDRTNPTQLNDIVDWDYSSNIGPEVGVTYTLKIYDEDDGLVRTETGLTGTSYTYSEANERADCGLGPTDALNSKLRFEFFSVRGSYESWQQYDLTVERSILGEVVAVATTTGALTVL